MPSPYYIRDHVRPYLLLMLLLAPMFFIGIRDTQDWGDDFAIYIQGALNLIHHQPVSRTTYISFEHYNHSYPPAAVPVGFPLLLTPVISLFGLHFKALDYYMTFWLYALALIVFTFLRRYLSTQSAIALCLIFFLNPFMTDFKSEIISDLPFAFFSTLALLLYLPRDPSSYPSRQLLLGLTVALLIAIRSIGWCTFLCFAAGMSLTLIRYFKSVARVSQPVRYIRAEGLWLLSFAVGYVLLYIIAGHSRSSSLSFYIASYQGIHIWELLMANLNLYIQNFQGLFEHNAGIYGFGIWITKAAMLFCFLIGLFYAFTQRDRILLIYFLMYSLAVLLSPFNTQGFRLFFPLFPIFVLYIGYGARSINIPGLTAHRYIWIPVITILILLQYKTDLLYQRDHQAEPIYPTPISADCRHGFSNIQALTDHSAIILSTKPRACALFTDRHFCVIPDGADPAAKIAKLSISKPGYLLVIKEIDNNMVESMALLEKDSAIYEDTKFKLYKRKM